MKRNKRAPLLHYWTTRYLITLFIGIIIIGLLSTLLIRYNAIQKSLDGIKIIAEEIAESAVNPQGQLNINSNLSRDIERSQRFLRLDNNLFMMIIDTKRNLIFSKPDMLPKEIFQGISITMDSKQNVQQIEIRPGMKYIIVKQPIKSNNDILGHVIILHPFREMPRSPQEYQLLIIMLTGLALLGWFIIFSLTRELAKPIKSVADAAKEIVTGNYDIELDKNVREQEVFDLITSFKEMAERLRLLETVRTELLAGVTHELKTPITSISGLVQALKDEVVTGAEAREFLDICSKETSRLQNMVEDLLDFNYFATGDLKVQKESHDINQIVQEISYQWLIGQEDDKITINTQLTESPLIISTDAMRLQQVFYNLFDNAKQAFVNDGIIDVAVYMQDGEIKIDITDNGTGIPEEEQPLIFERFFRGKAKKDRVRGLGLGLAFSKIITKALGGDLVLKNSSLKGTTFTIMLPV